MVLDDSNPSIADGVVIFEGKTKIAKIWQEMEKTLVQFAFAVCLNFAMICLVHKFELKYVKKAQNKN